jgi:hypothetical protein
MSTDTTEKGFESHISQYLVEENKYLLRKNKAYNNVSPTLRSQAHCLVAQKSQRTTKTSQRACLPERTADCKIDR